MPGKVPREEIEFWLERLRSGDAQEMAQAASELSRLHVRTRGAVRTRGSLARAATAELDRDALGAVLDALRHTSAEVRREVAYAVGQWGDERAAKILATLAAGEARDADEGVRRAALRGLQAIGGPAAVRALRTAAEGDESEAVRYEAIDALTVLALYATTGPARRVPGAVRTRGALASPASHLSLEAREALKTLESIRDNPGEKEYLRQTAQRGAASLRD